jgi:phosphoserine phosphatase
MVVFDLDGTLTTVDSLWRYMHAAFGTWQHGQVAAERYQNREISYKEWAEADAKHWAGVSIPRLETLLDGIPYQEGAKEVFNELKKRGVKIVILSAGLSILAEKAAKELGADAAVANELRTDNGRLTGEIDVKVAVDSKEIVVREIASMYDVPLREVALVGDRGFDLGNPECLRIAFMPKDDVARLQANHVIETADLREILQYLM